MSREIKFRAWLIVQKKMVEISSEFYIKHFMDNTHYIDSGTIEGDGLSSKSEFKLLQYTGLKDKNGKEIYEGDIIDVCNGSINGKEWKDKPYAVEYKPKGFDICLFCWDDEWNSIMDKTHWCEVIGNIYENPELLNS